VLPGDRSALNCAWVDWMTLSYADGRNGVWTNVRRLFSEMHGEIRPSWVDMHFTMPTTACIKCEKVQVGSQTMSTSSTVGVTIGEFIDDVSGLYAQAWLPLHHAILTPKLGLPQQCLRAMLLVPASRYQRGQMFPHPT